jgi:hypothetical protein
MSDDDRPYMGSTALPGASGQQDLAIEMALRMIDNPEAHDGLKGELFAIPGASGFSDQQMQQAIARVLNDHRTDAQ